MWPHSFARTLLGFTLGDLVHHTAFRINGCFIPDFRQPVDPQEEVHAIMTRVDEIKMLYSDLSQALRADPSIKQREHCACLTKIIQGHCNALNQATYSAMNRLLYHYTRELPALLGLRLMHTVMAPGVLLVAGGSLLSGSILTCHQQSNRLLTMIGLGLGCPELVRFFLVYCKSWSNIASRHEFVSRSQDAIDVLMNLIQRIP